MTSPNPREEEQAVEPVAYVARLIVDDHASMECGDFDWMGVTPAQEWSENCDPNPEFLTRWEWVALYSAADFDSMRARAERAEIELSLHEPYDGDGELLERALANLGIAGPDGKEDRRARWRTFVHRVLYACAERPYDLRRRAEQAERERDGGARNQRRDV